MNVDDGKTPLWMRGDSNRGLALWPVEDGYVLSVHLDDKETNLHLSQDDLAALHEAIGVRMDAAPEPVARPGDVEGPAGPPCDRCKSMTVQIKDGYVCNNCGNEIIWL